MPSSATPAASPAWAVIVPVKPLVEAKSRLADAVGRGPRAQLALAFAQDAVSAAARCPLVSEVAVVTADPLAARELTALGARVLAEPGRTPPPRGAAAPPTVRDDGLESRLNAALAHAAAALRAERPGQAVAALSADLPALRPDELARVLAAAARHPRAFLPDADGLGTTVLTAGPGTALAPAFGGASGVRHAASGAVELVVPEVESVRRDVDTAADLRAAFQLGVGTFTARRHAALLPKARERSGLSESPSRRGS